MPELAQLLPTLRSIAIGVGLVVVGVLAYVGARSTSVFAVQTIDVRGGTPALRAEVRSALADEQGTSLMRIGGTAVASRLDPIPGVRSFEYDRAFPHTLRVTVKREVPVLVVRQVPGTTAYLVAASGKVIKQLPHPRLSHLPRLWVTKEVQVGIGDPLPRSFAGVVAGLASLRGAGLPGGVTSVRVGEDELTLLLGGGLEVRLGDPGDVRLKLAIVRRILRLTSAAAGGTGYIDVSVPSRPVLSTDPQVGG